MYVGDSETVMNNWHFCNSKSTTALQSSPDHRRISTVDQSPAVRGTKMRSMAMGEEEIRDCREVPRWLPALLRLNFFEACPEHRELRKNELNTYCIQCDRTMCQNCLQASPAAASASGGCDHPHQKVLQIRRYVYQSVVRVHDIHKFLDCSKIQPFTVNSAKVVLLNSKNNGKGTTGKEGQTCEICQRSISDSNRFCSIACKFRVFPKHQQAFTSPAGGRSRAAPATVPSSSSSLAPAFVEEDSNPIKSTAASLRRRPEKRKGIPSRAPFI